MTGVELFNLIVTLLTIIQAGKHSGNYSGPVRYPSQDHFLDKAHIPQKYHAESCTGQCSPLILGTKKKSESPRGIESMTSQTQGGRSIHLTQWRLALACVAGARK